MTSNYKEGVLMKIWAIMSTLYVLVIWVAKLSTLIQFLKAVSLNHYLQVPFALTTLISSSPHQSSKGGTFCTIRSYLTLPSLSLSSASASEPPTPLPSLVTSSQSSILSLSFLDDTNTSSLTSPWSSTGDLLGTESGILVSKDEDFELPGPDAKPVTPIKTLKTQQKETTKRNFPPPIPLLVQGKNFGGRMPWTLRKEFVDDRLIIRVVQSDDYEYFEKTRENGSLVLKLVRPAAPVQDVEEEEEEEDEEQTCIIYEENEMKEKMEVNKGKKKMHKYGAN